MCIRDRSNWYCYNSFHGYHDDSFIGEIMGFGGISIWQLLIILVVVLLIFGSGKLKSLGSDLGSSIKGFKKAVKEEDSKDKED